MPDSRREESPESINGAVGPNVEGQETGGDGEVTGGAVNKGEVKHEQDIDADESKKSDSKDDPKDKNESKD